MGDRFDLDSLALSRMIPEPAKERLLYPVFSLPREPLSAQTRDERTPVLIYLEHSPATLILDGAGFNAFERRTGRSRSRRPATLQMNTSPLMRETSNVSSAR